MTALQARLHEQVCIPSGLTACLCGAYARVGEEYAKDREELIWRAAAREHRRHCVSVACREGKVMCNEYETYLAYGTPALSAGAGEK